MATQAETKPGLIKSVRNFLEEVYTEMQKVTWPTREDLKASTQVTLILLGVIAVIIFAYDQAFQAVILALLSLAS